MSFIKLIEQSPGIYMLQGNLDFSTIDGKTALAVNFSQSDKKICIDMSKIKTADSAGLALIIEWIKQSKLHHKQIAFRNMPEQLLLLSKLSGFDIKEYLLNRE